MNSIHDMGGTSGFGAVRPTPQDDPPFHAPWEGTVFAMQRLLRAQRVYHVDEFRYAQECLDPVSYLRSTYYERWLEAQVRLLVGKGLLREGELEERASAVAARVPGPRREDAVLLAMAAPPRLAPTEARPPGAPPAFRTGDRVRTRNMHPRGHTRLPRYARDKEGVVDRLWGTYVFPDAHAAGRGESPQPLYCVAFEAQVLWGDHAEPQHRVSLDLFESYLLPA